MKLKITDYEQFATQTARAFGIRHVERDEDWPLYVSGCLEPVNGIWYDFNADFKDATLALNVKIWIPEFKAVGLVIWPDGTMEGTEGRCEDETCRELLVKGLSHLSFLTPEVQEALEISVSAHQQIEWALEHERRMQADSIAETIDWPLEAKRIGAAFGLEGECEFGYELGRFRLKQNNPYPRLADGSYFDCDYFVNDRLTREFTIRNYNDGSKFSSVWFISDGRVTAGYQPNDDAQFSRTLARGLFNLGLLTPEVEAVLNLSISPTPLAPDD